MIELCPINIFAQKWHLAYFVPIDGHFDQWLEIRNSNLFCPVFTLTFIYKPIRPKLAILSLKYSKNSPKWPYLKTPFCPSVFHQKAYSSYIFQ